MKGDRLLTGIEKGAHLLHWEGFTLHNINKLISSVEAFLWLPAFYCRLLHTPTLAKAHWYGREDVSTICETVVKRYFLDKNNAITSNHIGWTSIVCSFRVAE